MTSYLAVVGTDQISYDGVMYVNSRTADRDIRDGRSHTLLAGERPVAPDLWWGMWFPAIFPNGFDAMLGVNERRLETSDFDPREMYAGERFIYEPGDWSDWDYPMQPYETKGHLCHYWSNHSGGANFLFADGHVEKLSYNIGQEKINALATRAGGEVIGKSDFE